MLLLYHSHGNFLSRPCMPEGEDNSYDWH